jgi:lycopene cyclase domain-containing protein
MDIYESWLPKNTYYLVHLLLWMGPIVLFQWAIAGKILWRHRAILAKTTLILGSYLIATDVLAVYWGIWYFDKELILGINPLGVPIEEWLFFYLTVLLVTQSFIMFLPNRYRLPQSSS